MTGELFRLTDEELDYWFVTVVSASDARAFDDRTEGELHISRSLVGNAYESMSVETAKAVRDELDRAIEIAETQQQE